MLVTLTKMKNEETSLFQTVIDNADGKFHLALRSLYEVGYRNIGSLARILWRSTLDDHPRNILVPAGMYTFEQQLFIEQLLQASFKMIETIGLLPFSIPEMAGPMKLSG